MTHADLVQRAARWLRRTQGCGVVLTEHTTGREFPDAIGWRGGLSILVECKVSRADFHADQRKPSRQLGPTERPAWQCYYMTPPGLLKAADLPEWWGLLEVESRRVRVAKDVAAEYDDRADGMLRQEVRRLYQELRRYQAQGLKPQTYAAFRSRNQRPAVNAVGEEAR